MSYLERKRNAIMSVTNTVRGYLRSASGEPPLTLTDCYPDKLKIKLWGQSTQPTGTYYTADHTITEAECNYTTRKIWFDGNDDGYTGNFYVYDGFAYWCFALVDGCAGGNYYIDCLRESIFEEIGDVDQEIEVFSSSTIPAGYRNFALTVVGDLDYRTGNIYIHGATTCSLGTVNGKYANFMPEINLVFGTKLLYDSYAPTLKYQRNKVYIDLFSSVGAGTYYLIYDGKFYRFTTISYLDAELRYYLDTVNCAFYRHSDVGDPTLLANADLLSSTPSGATQLTVDDVVSSYDSITFTESATTTGTILSAENVTSNTYPDTVHPQAITSPTAGGTVAGFNLWDEQWEVGGLYLGNPVVASDRLRSKNHLSVSPAMTYYIKGSITVYLTSYGIAWYDFDKNFISTTYNVVRNQTFIIPANAFYLKFVLPLAYGTTYNNDICINLSNPALNGIYEPFYTPANITVTKDGQPVSLYGLPVSSDGNVTIGGQQYLSDVLTDNGDGTGMIARWNEFKVFDETGAWVKPTSGATTTMYQQKISDVASPSTVYPACLFDRYSWNNSILSNDEVSAAIVILTTGTYLRIRNNYASLAEFLADIEQNPVTCVRTLTTPTTETVTITKNKAVNGTTIITSDCPYIGAEYYSWEV